jgi:hypothetical protein
LKRLATLFSRVDWSFSVAWNKASRILEHGLVTVSDRRSMSLEKNLRECLLII